MKALMFLLLVSPFALAVFHALAVRCALMMKVKISNQALVVLCILLFFLPVLAAAWLVLQGGRNDPLSYIYVALVYFSFAYFYFHIFNMSETARRIKILMGIQSSKIRSLKDIPAYYDIDNALTIRLKRLIQLGQIRKKGVTYSLKGRVLYYVSFLIPVFRFLLAFDDVSPNICS